MRKIVQAVLAASIVLSVLPVPVVGAQEPAPRSRLSDPALLAAIDDARAQRRLHGGPQRFLTVELLTDEATAARAAVVAAGGSITGEVPGELLQARVPVDRIEGLTAAAGVRYVKAPRRAGYLTPPDRPVRLNVGTGVQGAELGITNADDWQLNGFTGSGVKVGIVDFFNFARWAQVMGEAGPVPDSAHQFCQDSVVPPPSSLSYCTINGTITSTFSGTHGVAVAEIVKDMAPDAELFVATVATTADLQAAVNWFASKGVTIVTRSLGAAYDGPGDGTGPLAAVVNSAVAQGITWFNSAGNDGQDAYMKFTVPTSLGAGGYVDFDEGPGVDTYLRIDGECVLMDGVRWANDWYLPANQRTDYRLEFYEPIVDLTALGDHYNPTSSQIQPLDLNPFTVGIVEHIWDASQIGGATPLEGEDLYVCHDDLDNPLNSGISYLRIRRNVGTSVGATADTMEIGVAVGLLEINYSDTAGSAAKPVVDSKSPGLVAVGAVDPPAGSAIAPYSSQGPTTDGRIKPDVSAPAGFYSAAYDDIFSGTSAASPVAAGMAALLQGGGLAAPGVPTASLVKHLTIDLGAPGRDNAFGEGKVLLPVTLEYLPPHPPASAFYALDTPYRLVDTRPSQNTPPPGLAGPFAPFTVIDVPLTWPNSGEFFDSATSVVVNITSVNSVQTGYVQAYPTLRGMTGGTSTLSVSYPGMIRSNMAVVPVGYENRISVYLHAGGDVVIDVLGAFIGFSSNTALHAGRFVALDTPERWMDTRGELGAPLPASFGSTPRRLDARETVSVARPVGSAVPDHAGAVVVTVTAAAALAPGFLRAFPTDSPTNTATVNYTTTAAAGNLAIVPVDSPLLWDDESFSIYSHQSSHVIVDVVGYFTSIDSPADTSGLFMALTPHRRYDSRTPTPTPLAKGETRPFSMVTPADPLVPAGASAVSMNVTITEPAAPGFARVFALVAPITSTVNYATNQTVAGAAFSGLDGSGTLRIYVHTWTHLVLDINGYFLA